MKKDIARSGETIPDAATFYERFPDGGFRWDMYDDDKMALIDLLRRDVQSGDLTEERCRTLLLNTAKLDGAYAEGYAAVLTEAYRKDEAAYMQAWRGLTYQQQSAVPADLDDVLPQALDVRWSYDSSALSCPYMTVNGGGTVFYMEIPDQLAARIEQRVVENVTLGGLPTPTAGAATLSPGRRKARRCICGSAGRITKIFTACVGAMAACGVSAPATMWCRRMPRYGSCWP